MHNLSDNLKAKLEIELEKFNPKYNIYAIYDYLRVRFATHDYESVIRNILKMNFKFFINEDYGFYGYKGQYRFADIVIMVSDKG